MVVGTFDGENKVLGGQIVLAINDEHGSTALIQADTIDIQGIVDDLAAYSISVADLTCNTLHAQGVGTSIECEEDLDCGGNIGCAGNIGCNGGLSAASLAIDSGGTSSLGAASCESLTVPDGSLTVGANAASWQSFTYRHVSLTNAHNFDYTDTGGSGTVYGSLVGSYTDSTIYFVGRHS
jgi:hypothetical protein